MSKAVGWLALLLGLVSAGYGVASFVAPSSVTGTPLESTAGRGAALGLGLILVFIGIIFLTRKAPPVPEAPAPEPPPAPEPVEIKRTEMNWGASATAASDDPSPQLEELHRRQANLKVQLGLGQVSPDAYKRLSAELAQEEAELERKRRDAQA